MKWSIAFFYTTAGSMLFFLILAGILGVIGFSTVDITAPDEFSYQATLSVNVSCGLNVSAFPWLLDKSEGLNFSDEVINVTILNRTEETGAYGILGASLDLTLNATNRTPDAFWNYTYTATNGRQGILCNFTNVSRADNGAFGGALTAERLVQIDVDYNILAFNFYNFSFPTADGTTSYCGVSDANVWACSS